MNEKLHKSVKSIRIALLLCLAAGAADITWASELGHYGPALPRIRDFFVPDPGSYYVQYHMYYTTDTLKDKNGDRIKSIDVGPIKFNVETEVDSFMIVPTFLHVTDKKILKANYAFLVSQPLGDVSVQAALESATIPGFGFEVDESSFGMGDTYIRPLWLGWNLGQIDVAAGYGIYVPTGKYDGGDDDNVGLGMWTHEFMLAGAYYPDDQRGTALTLAALYEIHHNKKDVDIRPGSHLTINYGVSQYLPVTNTWLAELGIAGFAQWQVTRDHGSDAVNKDVKDQVYGLGLEAGMTYLPWAAQLSFGWKHEFKAEDRFEGDFFTLTLAATF